MHKSFYSHVNYSVTKILHNLIEDNHWFYSHVNYSVTKIGLDLSSGGDLFYSHVNYSVTKIDRSSYNRRYCFTVT